MADNTPTIPRIVNGMPFSVRWDIESFGFGIMKF